MDGPLDGKTVLVPESRELDLFAGMLEAQGAKALRCPLVAIRDLEDPTDAQAWIERVAAGSFDDLILQTGEGLRRLIGLAGPGRESFITAVGRLRTIVRGPKPVRALRDIGLRPSITAPQPTSAGLIEALSSERLEGRRVALQSYPDASAALQEFLASRGALVDAVVPYAYASDSDDQSVVRAIEMMAAGLITVAAFTSSPQARRLSEVAHKFGIDEKLAEGFARTRIAAVGPLIADALEAVGAEVTIAPQDNFHLKPLVSEILKAFGPKQA
jgi:uroporphyrinogen-III synthase